MRKLSARFIDQSRRKARDVAEGDRMVGIAQIGRSARRTQPAGAARIPALNIVDAVTDAELIS